MMRFLALVIGLLNIVACNREATTVERGAVRNSLWKDAAMTAETREAGQSGDPSSKSELRPDAGSLRECEAILSRLEMRLAVSPADDGLTSLVDKEMRDRRVPFPNNHKFVISRRSGHSVVTVVDFEAVCRGERPRSITYHIGKRAGRLRILFQEAGI
jgi:hypothetical protein